jgi:hypothetical protein
MTKNLLRNIMIRPEDRPQIINTKALIEKINSGYTAKRGPKHTQKKTFAPSTSGVMESAQDIGTWLLRETYLKTTIRHTV